MESMRMNSHDEMKIEAVSWLSWVIRKVFESVSADIWVLWMVQGE